MKKNLKNPLSQESGKYEILVQHRAGKHLKKIPYPWQKRIKDVISGLESNPYAGSKLCGELNGLYKLKVWLYRIIFEVCEEEKKIKIHKIEHRQGVYKK